MIDPKLAPWGIVETHFAPIHSAARMRDVEAGRQHLAAGADVDLVNGRTPNGDGGNTALWFAAQGPWPNGVDAARVLIAAGADVNKPCEHGRNALHMAAAWGHADVAELLLKNGADPTIPTTMASPLLWSPRAATAPTTSRPSNGASSANCSSR
jgi:ankyrin repeat protein